MSQLLSALLLSFAAAANPAPALPRDAVEGLTGLPTPRFVSLSSGMANLRTGPGDRYPVTWLYQRKGLPLKVVKEYGIWRQVVDPDGETGWMHRTMISSQRTAIVVNGIQELRARPEASARVTWQIEPGVTGNISDCANSWCRFTINKHSGYIRYDAIWGVAPNEKFD